MLCNSHTLKVNLGVLFGSLVHVSFVITGPSVEAFEDTQQKEGCPPALPSPSSS